MRKQLHFDRLCRIIGSAQERGAKRVSGMSFQLDVAGKCQNPRTVCLFARPPASERDPREKFADHVRKFFPGAKVKRMLDERPRRAKYIRVEAGARVPVEQRTRHPLQLELQVRCRKCDKCRELRRIIWSQRAQAETQVAPRTWFGTLTLSPEAQVTMGNRARVRLAAQGIDFEAISFADQFAERHREIGSEITKYLKRVRKQCGSFRYLLVVEHHKSGLPHYHMLVHEVVEGAVTHAVLAQQWQIGFEKWRLVAQTKQATYLCKYLAKTNAARVRASAEYGSRLPKFSLKTLAGLSEALATLPAPPHDYPPSVYSTPTPSEALPPKGAGGREKDLMRGGDPLGGEDPH